MLRKIKSVIPLSRYPVIPPKIKDYILCILSAVLLIFSFPNFNIWLFAWFGFVPLFLAIRGKSKGKAFLLSYLTGILFWFGTIYWLIHVTLAGLILLVLYLAVYFGILGLIVSTIDYQLSTIDSLLFIPSLWVLLEYIRTHLITGFPWALLGYSQYLNLPIIQIADITGAWGVSFLVMMVNVLMYSVMRRAYSVLRQKQVISIRGYFVPIFLISVSLIYGFYHLHNTQYSIRNTLKVSVIQGNIPQELKWDPKAKDFIINKYFTLTAQAAKDKPDLIIWPEAALPCVLEEEPLYFKKVEGLGKEIKIPLLLGAVTAKKDIYYNSALLLSAEGKLLTKYDKLRLVPFGEYIPLRRVLRFLETVVPIGDFTQGEEYTIFYLERQKEQLAGSPVIRLASPNKQTGTVPAGRQEQANRQTKFSVLICFEDIFPELARKFVNKGADFLVNITNDAWFKKTSSPYQHLQASVFRAVENRIFLVRVANTGISGFIAPTGKIVALVQDRSGRDIFVSGYRTQEIFLSKRDLSFYSRYGDIFVAACLLFALYGIILKLKNLRHKTWRIRQGFWRKN